MCFETENAMDHKRRSIKNVFTAMIVCFLFAAVILQPALCYAEERPSFTITVEEEIPAVEIEENGVPLAAFSQEDNTTQPVIIVCVLTAAVCAAAYLIYFARLKKHLGALRAEAAFAEQRWVETYRKAHRGVQGEDR